jgi:DNA-directed RNA polymerase specialized sigma24 family protein
MVSKNSGSFPPTSWSLLDEAADRDSPDYVALMNRFITGYWKPVYYFLRVRGYSPSDAEDLTQEFFYKFMDRNWIAKADRNRGRFRTFLLTILIRFLSDQSLGRAPKQKSFEKQLVPISTLVQEEDRTFEPVESDTPDEIFMRQWAQAVIRTVRHRLQLWCEEQGRPDWYAIFAAQYFPGAETKKPTQDALAMRFRVTRDQVRYALGKMNTHFVELLRELVADQVNSQTDIDDEVHVLERLLGDIR